MSPPAGTRRGLQRFSLAGAVGMVFVLWGALIGSLLFNDNSLITHIATGRLILDGHFPRSDPYSFTAAGEPWVVQSWLPSVLFAALERTFGSAAIHLFTGTACALLGAIVWRLTAKGDSLLVRFGLAVPALLVGASLWAERPLLVGLLGLGVVLLIEERALRDIPLWVLVPVFWVWANSHGSFPLGLVLIGALWLGRRLDGEDGLHERQMALWSAVGTVLAVLSPLGPAVLTFPVRLVGRTDALSGIVEWRSPDFGELWARVFLLQLVLAVVALVRRPRYRAAVPLLVFTAAALLASRNVAVASLVLLPGAAEGLQGLGSVTGRERRGIAPAALFVSLAAIAGLTVVSASQGESWDFADFPVAALAWSDQNGLVGPDDRLMTEDFVGNLQEGIVGADARVFADDRFDMFPLDVIDDYRTIARGQAGWADVLDAHEIDAVLWRRDQPASSLLLEAPDWMVRYQDDRFVIFVRR